MKKRNYSEITPGISKLSDMLIESNMIDPKLYTEHKVNRGLRDLNGKGVLTGLTEISEICSRKVVDGVEVPCDGELYYRGYNIIDLVKDFIGDNRFGFEEITYLLIFGELPSTEELAAFKKHIGKKRELPLGFARDMILTAPSINIMNKLARSVLALYSYDENPDDTSIENMLRQSIELIGRFPVIVANAYAVKRHHYDGKSLHLHIPKENNRCSQLV